MRLTWDNALVFISKMSPSGITNAQIAAHFGCDPSDATNLTRLMLKAGEMSRHVSPGPSKVVPHPHRYYMQRDQLMYVEQVARKMVSSATAATMGRARDLSAQALNEIFDEIFAIPNA